MSKASSLVAKAKEWAGNYGSFANGRESAVLSVPLRVRGAWEKNDADGVADVFAEAGSMLVGDDQLTSREDIRAYLAKEFTGSLRGTLLVEEPVDIRFLTEDVAIAVTEGGVRQQGETDPPAGRAARTMWVTARQDGEWRLVCYQTSPIAS